MGSRSGRIAAATLAATLLSGCAASTDAPVTPPANASDADASQRFPDVLEASLTRDGEAYTITVTMSSPYDTPQRYADGWRVVTTDGAVLAEHTLTHDHADEQPFTRSRGPFVIPPDADEVIIEGRDSTHGYGGQTITVTVDR